MREKVHHFKYCPQCKANVEPYYRFCRSCFCWLAKEKSEGIRALQTKSEPSFKDFFSRFWVGQLVFESAFPRAITAGSTVLICFFVWVVYSTTVLPAWIEMEAKARRNTCYANMRVIQTAIEQYCMERRFTRALASEPAKVLFSSGYLSNQPACPIRGNWYKIPRGSHLQCIGSEGHGPAW